ncbi:MAG: TraR/DksA C4-type zinc finger protein [Planctomycetes bacterium]|nr:TraR/DksA C4-type zinc finger protein [Planctomycetota bacterium]
MNLDQVRTKLLALRNELTSRHERIEKHIHHRDEPRAADSEERAGEMTNDETMELLDANALSELQQIDHALARIDAGTYGTCETCQRPIADDRLEFLPFASRCVGCAG